MSEMIYIMGAGRSGTTLVDIILGNAKKITSLGELNRYSVCNGKVSEQSLQYTKDFWSLFYEDFESKEVDWEELTRAVRKHEYHTSIYSIFLYGIGHSFQKYKAYILKFFDCLYPKIETQFFVDSSKYPLRLWHLLRLDIPVKACVYVKRNPTDVVRSFRKKGIEQPPKGAFMSCLYLMVVHALCRLTMNLLKKRKIICAVLDYNQLVQNPVETLKKLENQLGIDIGDVIKKVKTGDSFKTGCLFDGNRIRFKERISLDVKQKKVSSTYSTSERLIYALNSFWWP